MHAIEVTFLRQEEKRAINKNSEQLRDGLQKLIQQINHASCLAILYEDIQVGIQDAKCTKWLKLMGYTPYTYQWLAFTHVRLEYRRICEVLYIWKCMQRDGRQRIVATAIHSEVNKVAEDAVQEKAVRKRDSEDFSLPLLRNQPSRSISVGLATTLGASSFCVDRVCNPRDSATPRDSRTLAHACVHTGVRARERKRRST